MCNNLIFSLVLVAFVGPQFGESLICYTCNTTQSCQNPSTQVCDVAAANQTSTWLSAIHSDVLITAGNGSYMCLNLTHFTYPNTVKMSEILGCFHERIPVCSLTLNVTNSATWAKTCKPCDWDYCNRNPAGTYSKSSFTMIASVVGLLLAKLRA